MSERSISLAAGRSAGYVHGILKKGKDPTVTHLIDICEVIGVSVAMILNGIDLSPENDAIFREWSRLPKEQRDAISQVVKSFRR